MPGDTAADLRAWQIAHIKKGFEELRKGCGIPHEKMIAWLSSWGKENELPPPEEHR